MISRKSKKRRGWIIWLIALIGLALVVAALPVWQIKRVEVSGNKTISKDKILEVAAVPLGDNIFLANLKRAERKLEGLNQVKRADVRRSLPRKVVIEILERKPFAVLVMGNEAMIVDEDGVVLESFARSGRGKAASAYNVTELPVVVGLTLRDIEKGNRLGKEKAGTVARSVKLLSRFLRPSGLQLEIEGGGRLSLLVEDTLRVKIGRPDAIDEKINVFKNLLGVVGKEGSRVEYIDVSSPKSPVIKYRQ